MTVRLTKVRRYIKWFYMLIFCCPGLFPAGGWAVAASEVPVGGVQGDSVADHFRLREPGEGFLEQFRNDPAFNYKTGIDSHRWWYKWVWWLRRLFGHMGGNGGEWLGIVLQVLAVCTVIFLIYKLIRGKYGGPVLRKMSVRGDAPGADPSNPDEASYILLMEKSVAAGDYALALRLHYRYILRLLDARGIIRWSACRPNLSYCNEIKEEQLKDDFRRLVRIFDCVCYGEFNVDHVLYEQLAVVFSEFQKKWAL